MRTDFLPFHRPSIDDKEINEVVDSLKSGWITTGPKVKMFEEQFATYVGASNAVAVNSCTAALHLSLSAIGLQQNDEVILPTTTFAATAEVITYFGALPVLVDIRKDSFNIDASLTKAIIPVHMAWQSCDMNEIIKIAKNYDLKIIEDAAHALPSKYQGKTIGTIGDITTFSFYATKTITTGEGGMVTTENEEFAEKIRLLSLHGISKDAWKRYTSEGSWYYEILDAGFKYNMTDIAAGLGIQQLQKSLGFHGRRSEIAKMYQKAFAYTDLLETPYVANNVQHAWHLYMILLNLDRLSITRGLFIEELKNRNIGSSVHFIPLHLHPYYKNKYGYSEGDFKNSEWVYNRCVSLPIFPGMKNEDVLDVIESVKFVLEKFKL